MVCLRAAAIKGGELFYGYDTKFLFAEVNGARMHWTVDPEGNMTPIGVDKKMMGRYISTKAVSTISREDLTNNYKHPEGKSVNRATMEDCANDLFGDSQSEEEIRRANIQLTRDILKYSNRRDYKKQRVLLIGQSGSGKSSVINTLRKAITGDFLPIAKAGGGDVLSNTVQLNRYQNCGTNKEDFGDTDCGRSTLEKENMSNEASFKSILEKLPDIFDAAGMKNSNVSEETKEILRLLLGGYIPPNANMAKMQEKQKEFGLDYLPKLYNWSRDEYKISMVLFACACGSPIPDNLIRCVREVLEEVVEPSLQRRYDIDMFLLLTKYDERKRFSKMNTAMSHIQDDSSHQGNGTCITSDHLTMEQEIAKAFVISGMEDHTRLHWVSYHSSIGGYDNPYIDNRSLRLLKILTTPKHTNNIVDRRDGMWQKLRMRIHIIQNQAIVKVKAILFLTIVSLIVLGFAVVLELSTSFARR